MTAFGFPLVSNPYIICSIISLHDDTYLFSFISLVSSEGTMPDQSDQFGRRPLCGHPKPHHTLPNHANAFTSKGGRTRDRNRG